MDEELKTNRFVIDLPLLNKEPNIAFEQSLSHNESSAGKREPATKLGPVGLSKPWASAAQDLIKVLKATPSRILCAIHKPRAMPPQSKTLTWIFAT
uniref:Uncharacterized protein n=1 Tax=Cannabis sativa TaxID=3483 RepID=A0A803QXZ7_CANSA